MSEKLEHYWLPFSRCDIDPYHQRFIFPNFTKFHEDRGSLVVLLWAHNIKIIGQKLEKPDESWKWQLPENLFFAEKMGFGFLVSRLQFPGESLLEKHSLKLIWLVVSNIFYFHPNLGKIPILTNTGIFQMGWNHQLVMSLHLK